MTAAYQESVDNPIARLGMLNRSRRVVPAQARGGTGRSAPTSQGSAMERYFSVVKFAAWVQDGVTMVRQPVSLVHAKEMGTSQTVCGQYCATWAKLWHQPFPARGAEVCPTCEQITT